MAETTENGANGQSSNGASQEPTYDIPKTCKAGVIYDIGPNFRLKIEDVPVPEPEPDQVLLRLRATGLCFSDIHYMLNDLGGPGIPFPSMSDFGVRSPGHEGAGVIVKLGTNVKTLKVGQRAGMKPLWDTCGSCELCWSGKGVHCPGALQAGLQVPGTYQQYIVAPARYLNTIPDEVNDFVAGPIMCSASTMFRALNNSGLKPGAFVAFPGGGGGVGIQGVQLAKSMGFRPVVVDSGEEKRALALRMGAEGFVDFKVEGDNVAAKVIELCGGVGAHGVIVTAPSAYKSAISYAGRRIGATIIAVGLPTAGTMTLGTDPFQIIVQNLKITGSLVGDLYDTHMALDFARRGELKQICEVWPLHRMEEAVQKLRRGEVAGRIVVDFEDFDESKLPKD